MKLPLPLRLHTDDLEALIEAVGPVLPAQYREVLGAIAVNGQASLDLSNIDIPDMEDFKARAELAFPKIATLEGIQKKAWKSFKVSADGIEVDVGFATATLGVGAENG